MQIQYPASDRDAYVPGVCNIGPREIARRRRIGIAGLALAGLVAIGLLAVDAAPLWRVAVFPALAGGIVSLEQARRHFCAGFAMAGIRDAGDDAGREAIVDPADLASDRRAALTLFGYSSAIAAALALAFVALPI